MMNKKQIKWLFFDVGGTLVDETDSFCRRVQRTIAMQKEIGNVYTEEQLDLVSNDLFDEVRKNRG